MFRMLSRVFSVFVIALLPIAAIAQTGTSTIAGLVRDSSGSGVPGATVRVVNVDTGVSTQIVSDGEGAYRAPALRPGRYGVEIALDGFEAAARQVVVVPDQTAAVDVTLNPTRLNES